MRTEWGPDPGVLSPGPSPAPPPPPGFSISGPLVVFLILVTSLGCGLLCGILVYGLVKLYLSRCPSLWQGGPGWGWDSWPALASEGKAGL